VHHSGNLHRRMKAAQGTFPRNVLRRVTRTAQFASGDSLPAQYAE
jgi:hypothetical protein